MNRIALVMFLLSLTGCAQACAQQNAIACAQACGANGMAKYDSPTASCTCGKP